MGKKVVPHCDVFTKPEDGSNIVSFDFFPIEAHIAVIVCFFYVALANIS
jgi:hypothetical protein